MTPNSTDTALIEQLQDLRGLMESARPLPFSITDEWFLEDADGEIIADVRFGAKAVNFDLDKTTAIFILAALNSFPRLLALAELGLEREKIRREAIEQCLQAVADCRERYAEPTDWDYGAQNACTALERRLRTLSPISEKEEG